MVWWMITKYVPHLSYTESSCEDTSGAVLVTEWNIQFLDPAFKHETYTAARDPFTINN